ncbi:hypothetical protein M409DRAFT_59456 [Zasmidium cellare ATCC 36951]|uniref:Uncharacterized protein n=1 Tax=Zasmidium cellare ATCC 36951 TaxID=1080233 RepID=A0A6A6C1J9_ZASCE|nr:uncharacterized protein M409DRAFT_59456 [Zasmidium cellare ATCC 36951]KAF2160927.1 hypothetical protein M409DRAFT_59456 [Zasmidium cellare ATCC 36951]
MSVRWYPVQYCVARHHWRFSSAPAEALHQLGVWHEVSNGPAIRFQRPSHLPHLLCRSNCPSAPTPVTPSTTKRQEQPFQGHLIARAGRIPPSLFRPSRLGGESLHQLAMYQYSYRSRSAHELQSLVLDVDELSSS